MINEERCARRKIEGKMEEGEGRGGREGRGMERWRVGRRLRWGRGM